jgi:serine-type D-Ala-D-Ala carboxypeptidase/endopeptidase
MSSSLENKLKDLFSPFVKPESIHGLAVAVVNGEESGSVCLGYANYPQKTLLRPNHYFEIASITKTVVGILFSKIVLDQKITLDSKCAQFFPELQGRKLGTVTITELLTHSSGIPRLPSNLKPQNPLNPYLHYTYDDLMQEFLHLDIGNKKYLYSNLGFSLVGKIAEIIYKDKISNILRSEVLVPLGISGVNFSTDPQTVVLTDVHSHFMQNVEPWILGEFEAAGGMRATIEQMKVYLDANVWPEKTLLKDAILDSHKFLYFDDENKVGMGWHNGAKSGNVFHDGGTYGSSSFIEFNPRTKKGIVILSNTYSDFKELNSAIDSCLDF